MTVPVLPVVDVVDPCCGTLVDVDAVWVEEEDVEAVEEEEDDEDAEEVDALEDVPVEETAVEAAPDDADAVWLVDELDVPVFVVEV